LRWPSYTKLVRVRLEIKMFVSAEVHYIHIYWKPPPARELALRVPWP
jgi:hypothetical protein